MGRALTIEQILVAFCVAITLIKRSSCCGEVDKADTLFLSQLLRVVGIVHRVVVSGKLGAVLGTLFRQYLVAVAQVVTSIALNLRTAEVAAAHGRTYNRCGTKGFHLVDNLAEPFLVSRRRHCATQVDSGCCRRIINAFVVGFQGIAVHAVVLLVVMPKGDDDVVASLDILLGCLPELVIATTGVTSSLGIIDAGPAVGEEVSKIHTPAACDGGRLVVGCHGGVTQGVYFFGGRCRAKHHHQSHQEKKFCFHFAVYFDSLFDF